MTTLWARTRTIFWLDSSFVMGDPSPSSLGKMVPIRTRKDFALHLGEVRAEGILHLDGERAPARAKHRSFYVLDRSNHAQRSPNSRDVQPENARPTT